MARELDKGIPGGNLPEFRVYQGGKFVPRLLYDGFPVFMYSRISLSGEEVVFFQAKQVPREGDQTVCLISAKTVLGLGPDLDYRREKTVLTLEISQEGSTFWVRESKAVINGFFGNLWVLGEREIRRISGEVPIAFGSEIVLFPVTSNGLSAEQGVILAEAKYILPGSLGQEFIGEFVKGLVGLPIIQDSRALPAVFLNSDKAKSIRDRPVESTRPRVRWAHPESFYRGRRKRYKK